MRQALRLAKPLELDTDGVERLRIQYVHGMGRLRRQARTAKGRSVGVGDPAPGLISLPSLS